MRFLSLSTGSLTHLQQESHIPISEGITTDCFPSMQPKVLQKFQWLEGNEIPFFQKNFISYSLEFLNQFF
jgi:hypothetical protein